MIPLKIKKASDFLKDNIDILQKINLNERLIYFLEVRYGLKDGRIKSLRETAKIVGRTAERIRQVEAKVFDKIYSYINDRKKTQQ